MKKILVVVEDPKHLEAGCGRILNSLLLQSGISPNECWFEALYCTTTTSACLMSVELMKRRLSEKGVAGTFNVVIAMGDGAFEGLVGKEGLSHWRGSVLYSEEMECKVVATFSPQRVMRNWDDCPLVLFDLTKARKESIISDFKPVQTKVQVVGGVNEARVQLRRLMDEKTAVAFDIETDPEVNALTAIGFSNNGKDGFCIPFDNRFTIQEQAQLVQMIKEFLESDVPKIAQNAQFDILWLKEMLKINTNNLVLDTMVAHDCCYTEIPKKLEVLTSIYTNIPYYKNLQYQSGMLYEYNGLDAITTHQVASELWNEMDDLKVKEFYYKIPHPLLSPLMEMQERGVRVDLGLREQAKKEMQYVVDVKEVELMKEVGEYVNVNSPKQMVELLYTKLGLPKQFNKDTGRLTADEKALEKLSNKVVNPIFDLVLEIRGLKKVISTYLEMPLGKDNRIHTGYVIGGTVTGRLSSKRSLFYSGGNLQNIPKGICRRMFIPDEGKVFIEADLSQAEARIVALEAGEESMLNIFRTGGDVHTKNAVRIFGVKEEEVSKDQRLLAKKMVHALNYGLGYRAFAGHCKCSEFEAKQLIEKYFTAFPMIRQWHLQVENTLRKSRTLTNYFGRKRIFFGRWGNDLFREAYAFVPQSTIGDLLNLILIRTHNAFKTQRRDAQIMLQVHDSILIQCLAGEVKEVVGIVLESNDFCVDGITIPMEFKVGGNWDEMDEYKVEV